MVQFIPAKLRYLRKKINEHNETQARKIYLGKVYFPNTRYNRGSVHDHCLAPIACLVHQQIGATQSDQEHQIISFPTKNIIKDL